eukprot:4850578-Pleurochrysis_carterae.AAC.1
MIQSRECQGAKDNSHDTSSSILQHVSTGLTTNDSYLEVHAPYRSYGPPTTKPRRPCQQIIVPHGRNR